MPTFRHYGTGAWSFIDDGIAEAQRYAHSSYSSATNFLTQLQQQVSRNNATQIPHPDIDPNIPSRSYINANVPDISVPAVPTAPDLALQVPGLPAEPSITPVGQINVPSVPQFTPSYPVVSLPVKPLGLSAVAPTDRPTFTIPSTPDAPEYSIPAVPSLRELSLPDAPFITLPTFTQEVPEENLVAPEAQLAWTENTYSSMMLSTVQEKIKADVDNGTTGLPDGVEAALADKAKARERATLRGNEREALEEFASKGFSLPPGALAGRLAEARQDTTNKEVELSREIYVNQAERALQQMQFALSTAVALEGQLVSYANSLSQRAFDGQVAVLNAGMQLFNGKVTLFNSRVSAYRGYAEVFQVQTQAELAKLQVFQTELEAQKLIGEMNVQELEAFKASLSGVQSIVEIYKTEMQAAAIETDVQKLGLEAFRTDVEAYKAIVEAKATEYKGYAEEVNAEVSKIQMYKAEADAYGSEVTGYRAYVDTLIAKNRSDIEVNSAQFDAYRSKLGAYQSAVGAETARVQAEAAGFSAEIQAFTVEVGAEQAQQAAKLGKIDAMTKNAATTAGLEMKLADVNIRRALNSLEMNIEAIKGGAIVSAGLAEAALSAVNYSAGTQSNGQTSMNYSINVSD